MLSCWQRACVSVARKRLCVLGVGGKKHLWGAATHDWEAEAPVAGVAASVGVSQPVLATHSVPVRLCGAPGPQGSRSAGDNAGGKPNARVRCPCENVIPSRCHTAVLHHRYPAGQRSGETTKWMSIDAGRPLCWCACTVDGPQRSKYNGRPTHDTMVWALKRRPGNVQQRPSSSRVAGSDQ